MIRDLASREQSSDLGEAEEEEVSTEEINCLDVYTACQDEVYGASGLVGMSSVDSEQDTVNWQVRTQTLCHQHKHVLLNCDDKCNKILETCLLSWVRDYRIVCGPARVPSILYFPIIPEKRNSSDSFSLYV